MNIENNRELIFEVTQEADGGYSAECLREKFSLKATHGMNCAPTRKKQRRHSFLIVPGRNLSGFIWFETKFDNGMKIPRDLGGNS